MGPPRKGAYEAGPALAQDPENMATVWIKVPNKKTLQDENNFFSLTSWHHVASSHLQRADVALLLVTVNSSAANERLALWGPGGGLVHPGSPHHTLALPHLDRPWGFSSGPSMTSSTPASPGLCLGRK